MKKYYVLMFVFITLLSACSQLGNADAQEESDCLVSFNLDGEIKTTDTPMTKASTDDLFFVQVYRGSKHFAMGYFDDIAKMAVNLKKGTDNYRIIISCIRNGKILLSSAYSSVNNGLHSDQYGNDTYYHSSAWYQAINMWYYNSVGSYYYYETNNTTVLKVRGGSSAYKLSEIEKAVACGTKYPQCDDWFYGEINDYSPTGEYETLNMDLKRVGFKLKYELSGVTDGEVTVKVYNDNKTFIDNTTSTATYSSEPQFYAFYEARNAWLYADDYMENMTLAVSWKRGIGVTENYGTKTIQIKRNCLNNIKISLGSSDQSAGMNLTVESENTIGADGVTIPVQ